MVAVNFSDFTKSFHMATSTHYKIVMPTLLGIQLGIFLFSGVLLIRRRAIYPIKQLSPILTLFISASTIVVSGILVTCRLTSIHDNNGPILATLNILYVFFREFIILTFYMRCLRICAAYWKTQSKLVFAIFSREPRIALLAVVICTVPAFIQLVQYQVNHEVNQMTHFFPFYYTGGYELNSLDFFPLWIFDNVLFFVVLVLSLNVHERFKFTKSLIASCMLFHLQSWYNIISILSNKSDEDIRNYNEYCVMIIHTLFLWILLSPSLRPNQHEYPLPLESILISHSMALLDKQTYLIISEFSQELEERSTTSEERRREAATWLQVYSIFRITQKKIALIQLQQMKDGQERTQRLLRQFISNQIIPNLYINLIRDHVGDLFKDGELMTEENIIDNLVIEDFRTIDNRLNDAISHIFREWKRTKSFLQLREELRQNGKIIIPMTKLKIGI